MSTSTGTLAAALLLEGLRAMGASDRNELRALLAIDRSTATDPGGWMDSRSAADYLGVHRDTLRKLAAAGAIPSQQDGPGCKRYFRKTALDTWREAGGRFHAASMPPKTPVDAGGSG